MDLGRERDPGARGRPDRMPAADGRFLGAVQVADVGPYPVGQVVDLMGPGSPQDKMASMCDYMRCMRYLISRQWSILEDFDITGETGELRYQARGNFGFTQSLTITEPTSQRTAQITRTPFTTRHQVIIDGQQVAEVRHQFLGWNNCTIDSASGQLVAQGNFLGWQYTISQGERVVATLSKQGILPSTFEVDTADGQDDLFLLCLVLAIEQIHRERKRRRGAAS